MHRSIHTTPAFYTTPAVVWIIFSFFVLYSCRSSQEANTDRGDSCDSVMHGMPGNSESVDYSAEALHKADSTLLQLTLEERVGQCFMPSVFPRNDSAMWLRLRKYIADYHVGGIIFLKGDIPTAVAMGEIANSSKVPLFAAIDAEWGLGMRLEDAPGFPKNGDINDSADEQLLFDYGREVARECRLIGIDMVLGPVVDVVENNSGIIGRRSFGGDPLKVADFGVAYARGLESGGILSVAKHFPGHGSSLTDSHVSAAVVNRGYSELDSIDLHPFKNYIDAGLSCVMVGHLSVPSVDGDSLPAAVSGVVINGLLKEKLGFRGLVLTDALNMGGAMGFTASDALLAGADIVVEPPDIAVAVSGVVEDVRSGRMPLSVIDRHCRKILFFKFLSGIKRAVGEKPDSIGKEMEENAGNILSRLS